MKLIILAFIISISLHLVFFNNYKIEKKVNDNNKITTVKKQSNIKFVKIRKKEKAPAKIKPVKKEPIKKQIKQTKKKKSVKKITKTYPKKYIKIKEKVKYQKKRSKKITKDTLQNKILKEQIVNKKTSIQNKTLEDFLSQKEPVNKKVLTQIERLYGREFETFTKVQKAFLEKNLGSFKVITQRVLNRLGYPRLAAKLRIQGINIVEFMFYPDGSIKNLKITSTSGYEIFDKYTLELIEIAYKDYPKPKTATKLRFNVQYRLY